MVKRFLHRLEFDAESSEKPCVFVVATMSGLVGNSFSQAGEILKERGVKLDYSASFATVRNSVTNYSNST